MSFVACVVKSAAALVGLTVVFVLVGITIPDDPGWGTIMIPLLFALVILWNVLTTRWFLAAQSGRSPLPWFRTSLRSLPVWAQVLLAVLVAPLVMAELRGEHLLRVQPRQARVLLTVVES